MMRSYVFSLFVFMLGACADGELDLPRPEPGDDHLIWVWLGPRENASPCPHGAPAQWEAWTEVSIPPDCGACACGPTACEMPSKVTTNAAPVCPGEDTPMTFDAEEGWNGYCAPLMTPISNDAFATVTYEPPTLAPCVPFPTQEPPPISAQFARACDPDSEYIASRDKDFLRCIDPDADGLCDIWHTEIKFMELSDARTCTPCECGPPSGTCTAQITLYSGAVCTGQIDSTTISDTSQPACHVVPLGPLAAMDADWIQKEPGVCAPKTAVSAVVGWVLQSNPFVKCCAIPPEQQ